MVFVTLICLTCIFVFPTISLADLHAANEVRPRTPLDARNAFFAFLIHLLLLAVATAALACIVWWGIRLRRK